MSYPTVELSDSPLADLSTSDPASDIDADDDADSSPRPAASLSANHRQVADHYYDSGNESAAYRAVYRDCKSISAGKKRGRAVLARPEVAEYLSTLRRQGLVSSADSPGRVEAEKLAWEAELRHIAFSQAGGKGRIPYRDKVSALKLLGEAKDWFPKGVTSTGVKAVFNIRIGNQRVMPGGRVTIDAATGEPLNLSTSQLPGLPGEDIERSSISGRFSASASASDSDTLRANVVTGRTPPPSAAERGHFDSQVTDLHQDHAQTAPKQATKTRRSVRFDE